VDQPGLSSRLHLKESSRSHLRYQRARSLAVKLQQYGVPVLPKMMSAALGAYFSADVPLEVSLPPEILLMHNALGVVIHPGVRFEGPAIVFHGVTLGNSWGRREGVPVVGRHVFIGAGASVLGPVRIGDFCMVGAGAVVVEDVPDGHMAVGNPSRLLPADRDHLAHLFRIDMS
jgi:serine O-acetyltransferase